MNTKAVVAISLLAIFTLSSIAMIPIKPAKAPGGTLTLPDTELMLPEFTWEFDPGSSLTGKTDVAGTGVRFDLAGLGKAGIGDNFPLNPLAGGTGAHYSDFTSYSKYSMLFINLGSNPINVALFMNTGFTDPPQDWHYDTFWSSGWTYVGAGQGVIVTLDFSSCGEAWNIADDPVVEWQHLEGSGGWPVRRLDQVTNIGFQVLGSGSASVLVSGNLTQLYIDPPVVNKTPSDVCVTNFNVSVTLFDFARLMGFDIKLTWDGTLITYVSSDTTPLDVLWPGGWANVFEQSSAGSYELAVTSISTSASNAGASVLFKVKLHVANACNFPLSTSIHFQVVKLSDDTAPVPNPIYAQVTDGMYHISATTPDLEFKVKKWNTKTQMYEYINPPYEFEYCNLFEIEVWVTHICLDSPLTDYNLKIKYDTELAEFLDVDQWGPVCNPGSWTETTPGEVQVSGAGSGWSGSSGLLFTLTFHVQFACTPEHIWKYGHTNNMTFLIEIVDAELSFPQGTISRSGINMPLPLTIQVNFIRGDVDCDGDVDIFDIGTVAFYYGKTAPPEYDLTNNGVIDIYDLVAIATNYGYGL